LRLCLVSSSAFPHAGCNAAAANCKNTLHRILCTHLSYRVLTFAVKIILSDVRQEPVSCRYRLDFERRMQARQQLDTTAVRRAISGLGVPDEGSGADLTPQVAQPPRTAVLTTVLEFDSGLTGRTIQREVRNLLCPNTSQLQYDWLIHIACA
jgi:hypothetical protein